MYFNIDSDNNGTEVFGWGHNGNTTVADRLMTLDSGGRLGVGLQTPYAGTRVDTIVPTDANQWAFGARSFDAGTGNGTTTVNVLRVVNSSNGNWANAKYHAYSHNWGIGGTASNNSSMTLSANGDLSIGADAPPAGANRLYVQSTSTYATSFWQTDTSFAGIVSSIGCAAPAGTGFTLLQCMSGAPYTSSVAQFKVRGDGVLFAQNTAVQSLSDRSIKENIRDLEIGLSTINMLRPRRFDFIEGWGANKKNALGFIAQEVQEVLPELVTSEKFIDNSDAEHLTLGTTDLIPVLVKAIQELTAKNTALEARLSAAGL
jgi:hypothetical protein